MDRQFARAIRTYLALAEIPAFSPDDGGDGDGDGGDGKQNASGDSTGKTHAQPPRAGAGQYHHVFRMIEQHSLFDIVKDHVLQMIRLGRESTGELLLRHPDKLTVPSVVGQLRDRRDLQHWYLGLVFDGLPEVYGSRDFASFHVLQVKLRSRQHRTGGAYTEWCETSTGNMFPHGRL